MVAYITVGAKTTHGGTVITGSPQTTHYGIPVARKGDKVVCKKCKKVVTIITGDPSYIVDGSPVARVGDMTSCGSKLIASQQAFSESGFDVGSIAQAEQNEMLWAGPGSGSASVNRGAGKVHLSKSEQELEIDRIRKAYETMIARARFLGKDFAADNLQRFIDGDGGVKNINPDYIKQYGAIQDAEQRIRGYIERRQLQNMNDDFSTGSTSVMSNDYWNADIREYNPLSELAYASGASKIRSDVNIVLFKDGDLYKGKGTVNSRWFDDYNWNKGQGFRIPGTGTVSDDDGIYLKEYGGAKDFLMESRWQSSFEGIYNPTTKRWESIQWED